MFLMTGMFVLPTDKILVPAEMYLVPGFGLHLLIMMQNFIYIYIYIYIYIRSQPFIHRVM